LTVPVDVADRVTKRARIALGAVLVAALTVAWFYPVREGAIGFDDVGAVLHWTDPHVSLLDRSVLDVTANRWRPVFASLIMLLTIAFGRNYEAYFWFNVALTLALVLLVYRLVLRLSSSVAIATAIAVTAVTSRFAYYQVTQVIGPVEALSLVFLVLLIGSLVELERSGRVVHLGWAVLWFTLIIHTHERYEALILFLLPFVITSRHLAIRARAVWCGAFMAPLALNIAVRHFVFHLPLLVGTGSSTELGFTWRTTIQHYFEGGLNIFGVNVGPEYLRGLTYPFLSGPYRVASLGLLVLSLVVLGAAFAVGTGARGKWLFSPGPRRSIMFGTLLILVLILSVSVTIRVEPRFLYAPFLVLLLLVAYSLSLLAQRPFFRPVTFAILVVFVTTSVALDRKYADNLAGVYFMSARSGARQIVEQTVGRHGRDLVARRIYVVDGTAGADWQSVLTPVIMANSHLGPVSVTTVRGLAEVPVGTGPLVYDVTGGFHEFQYPATGFQPVGESYGDGWVGRSFGVRGNCQRLTMTIRPFRAGPGRYVSITAGGQKARRYPLAQPEVTVALTGKQFAGGLDATFDRTFIPRDEGVGQDVRSLAARVSIDCVSAAGR
jgi:hypothetical protein